MQGIQSSMLLISNILASFIMIPGKDFQIYKTLMCTAWNKWIEKSQEFNQSIFCNSRINQVMDGDGDKWSRYMGNECKYFKTNQLLPRKNILLIDHFNVLSVSQGK